MKNTFLVFFLLLFSFNSWSQSFEIKGNIIEAKTQKKIANVELQIASTNFLARTDAFGNFSIKDLPSGNHQLIISFTGFTTKYLPLYLKEHQVVDLGIISLEEDISSEIQLGLVTLTESDFGDDNSGSESTSGLLQASRDVFQQVAAYSWGQTRFRMRGLDNEYGNVLINGISMNKIFDGRPQFSNWGGLNDATRNQEFIQYSKPSDYIFKGILGTQAIDSRATSLRPGTRVSLLGTNTNYNHRTMITHASGLNTKGWAYAFSASYRGSKEGFFEGTDYSALSLFAAVEKRVNEAHHLNFTAMYAQNSRGKNSPNTQEVIDLKGYKYNSYWGWQNNKKRNSRDKDVNEPLFILSHYWKINEETFLNTNVAYQFGTIKNSRLDYNNAQNPDPIYYRNLPSFYLNQFDKDTNVWTPDMDGAKKAEQNFANQSQIDWDGLYRANSVANRSVYALYADVMQDNQFTANSFLRSQLSSKIGLNAGLTYRNLHSSNFQQMLDLLGGAYFLDTDQYYTKDFSQSDLNNPNRKILNGDKYGYNYIINSNVFEEFAQFKFNYNKVDFYLAQSLGFTSYQRDGLYKNGLYPEDSFGKSKKASFTNFGFKGGATYFVTGNHLLDANVSFYTQAPGIRNSFLNAQLSNSLIKNLSNEEVFASDFSYIVRMPKLKGRATLFYNEIKNTTRVGFYYAEGVGFEDSDSRNEFVSEIATGLNRRNLGIEFGLEYQLTQTIKLTAAANLSQGIYSSNPNVGLNIDGRKEEGLNSFVDLGKAHLKNYRIGGTPQNAYSFGIEYRDPSYWWVGANMNYLTHLFVDVSSLLRTSNFFKNPERAGEPFNDIDLDKARKMLKQEKLNNIFLVNLMGGKSWRVFGKTLGLFAVVNNVFNLTYKSGGFEQARNANYPELLKEQASGTPSFGPRYFHGFGRTFLINLYYNF